MKRRFHLSRGPEDAPDEARREIELHLDLRAREFEAQGMSPADARQAAIAAFGDRGEIEAEVSSLRESTLRERRRRDRLGELAQDIRITLRGLRRAPGFAASALLTLALAIGANSAVFSVVHSVLLRPLPYAEPDRLVQLWTDVRSHGRATPEWLTPPDFKDWQEGNRTFAAMAAYQGWGPDLTDAGPPEALVGAAASWNFLGVLGVAPAAGRAFTAADDDENAAKVVLISDGLWRRRFGGDTALIGRTIQLNGEPWTVVGVLPRDFRPPVRADVWRATRRPAASGCSRGCVVLRAIGRLKPGVTFAQAKADLDGIAARLARDFPQTNQGVGAWPIPLHEQVTGPTRPALLAMSGAVLLVLLLGCVNIASLLLLRGAARAREMSVRAALGAGRGRLLRQLLTESTVLAVAGGALGLLAGWWGSRLLGALVPPAVRAIQVTRLDGTVVAFTLGLTVVAGLLFGLMPALQTARPDLMSALRSAGRAGARHGTGLRRALVVAELALAVTLLIGAGLLGRSFLSLERVELGYRTDSLVTATVFFPRARYADPALAAAAIEDLTARLRTQRTLRGAEYTDLPPLLGGDQDMGVTPVGEPLPGGKPFDIWYRAVSSGYAQVMGMHLVAGRAFTPADRDGSVPVAIVNEEAARRMWPGKSPVGRQLASGGKTATVVGVVATALHDGPNQPVKAELFLLLPQFPTRGVTMVLDPRGDVASAVTTLRETLRLVDPAVPLGAVQTMAERAGAAVESPRLYALLVGVFAVAALALAVLGVYGVMAYTVAQRQREIGVRLALGAAPGAIMGLVLREGGRMTAMGVAIGILAAALMGRVLSKLLFQVGTLDAATYAVVALTLAAMSLVACWLPARRAMGVDPLVAIREE
ncbi:MAG: ABC transporter permease [Gemmatimonadales bacterium]